MRTSDGGTLAAVLARQLEDLDNDAAAIALSVPGARATAHRGALPGGLPTSGRTVMYAASLTKQLLGTLSAIATTEGRLTYETLVSGHVTRAPAALEGVRVRHLLHHTAGLPDVTAELHTSGVDNAAVLDRLRLGTPRSSEPGAAYAYDNAGYVVLGLVLASVFDQSIETVIMDRIFQPLGMRDSRIGGDPVTRLPGVPPPPATVGDGGWWTSVTDLHRWQEASNDEYFGSEIARLVSTPGVLNDGGVLSYAWGIGVRSVDGRRTLSHGGSWPGWIARAVRQPDHGVALSMLTSGGSQERVALVSDAIIREVSGPSA